MEKVNDENLKNLSGGKIIETKDGKFICVPQYAKEFDTEEQAKSFEAKINELPKIVKKPILGKLPVGHKGPFVIKTTDSDL